MTSADDEIRRDNEGWRLLGHEVQAELIARGWAVADLHVGDDEPLEFFWPPTAPTDYGERRAYSIAPRETPWTSPTRITQAGGGWRVEYGEALAQRPDEPVEHSSDQSLFDDLPRIEWWPMSIEEARTIEHQHVLESTYADAYDQHSQVCPIQTEPYLSRLQEVYDRLRGRIRTTMADQDAWRWSGDLRGRTRIISGQMWASAIRTARAGGDGWDLGGTKRVSR